MNIEQYIPYLPLLVLGLIVLVFLYSFYLERKRREALQRLAAQLGLSFKKEDRALGSEGFSGLNLFRQGHSKRFKNVMRGRIGGGDAMVFDYQYTVGGGKNSSTCRQTAAAFPLDGEIPDFELRPEHFLHKIGSVFGYQDIDFDTHPGFSKNCLLRGKDENAVRALFHGSLLEHFQREPGWSVEAGGRWIVFYKANQRVKPEDFQTFIEGCRAALVQFGSGGPGQARTM